MGQLTDTHNHKAQILAFPNANWSMAEIGRKIGFSKSTIYKCFIFYSGEMSASGDFAFPMSFPREWDPGTGTKNKIITDWQLSVNPIRAWGVNQPALFSDSYFFMKKGVWRSKIS